MWFGLLVIGIITLVGVAALAWTRWRAIGFREALPMESLYRQSNLSAALGFEDFSDTMGLIAGAYGLNAGKLRVTDSFRGNLATVNSTLVDDSAEILWRSVRERYPSLSQELRFDTILDLLRAVGARDSLPYSNQ